MLTCHDITQLATSYAEGALPFADRARFMMHLAMCHHCRVYVKQLRVTVQALGQVPQPAPAPTPEQQQALLATFAAWSKKPKA